jgi:hypothetical protein
MLSELLPSLRNLRVSLLTGGLIIGSLYVLCGHILLKDVSLQKEALDIVHLAPFMPQVLIAMLCILVGSLYMTALEGLVDLIHRKTLFLKPSEKNRRITKLLLHAVAPLSFSARRRIEAASDRFFNSYRAEMDGTDEEVEVARRQFKRNVLSEILWLEGKLVGTPLESPHDRYRAEGELRLGTALTMPLAAAAVAHAVEMSAVSSFITTLLVSVIALKLADYGLYYFRRSHSFLAHHIADGTVLVPAMEHLKSEYSTTNRSSDYRGPIE